MSDVVTVAIPTLNAGPELAQTLTAVRGQQVDRELELVICDSGSADATVAVARAHGARVIEIPQASFSHGGTRNLLMSEARGSHVAFLTQDAVPAGQRWLQSLLDAFSLAADGADVGLAFGPYRAREGASASVTRELAEWFESFSPDGRPRIDQLAEAQRDQPARDFFGHLGFFTDANGCVARAAWERVPFREIAYAEDHLLAQDMLRAGFAKVYVPGAAVIHSHEYSPAQWLRRSFDEARAVREVYGWAVSPREALRNVRGRVKADVMWGRRGGAAAGAGGRGDDGRLLAASLLHHGARGVGQLLGGRAERLPAGLSARLSLERRG